MIILEVIGAALAGGAVSILLIIVMVKHLKNQRGGILSKKAAQKMEAGLAEALGAVASGMSAGYSLQQSIEEACKSESCALKPVFSLILNRVTSGHTIDESLEWAASICHQRSLKMVFFSMASAHRSGTNLIGALKLLAKVSRDRESLKRKLDTMSAQGRLQGLVISLVPALFMLGLFVVSPETLVPVFQNSVGRAVLSFSFTLQLAGALIIRQIVKKDFL